MQGFTPSQQLYYLLRRLRLNEFKKFYANDELDWFSIYLTRGLHFEEDERFDEASLVMFDSSFSTLIDDYYFYSQGVRKKVAPKPIQPMPELLRRIIVELDTNKPATGYSEVILQLLDWDDRSRKQFVAGIQEIKKRVLRDRRLHDFTIISTEDKAGLTCFAALAAQAPQAMNQLQSYVQLKKYEQHANRWAGLLILVDRPGLIHGFTVSSEPWTEIEQLENVLPDPTISSGVEN